MNNGNLGKQKDFESFGSVFQNNVIYASLLDTDFFKKNYTICKSSYFTTDPHQQLWKIITAFYDKYKSVPTFDSLKIEISKLERESLVSGCFNIIEEIQDKKFNYSEVTHAKDTVHKFCVRREIVNAVYDSVNFIKEDKTDAIIGRIQEALKYTHVNGIGHDYVKDADERLIKGGRKTISTGYKSLDKRMDGGGVGKGELASFMAETGGGKSLLLVQIGYAALKQSKNVLHYTLELSEHNIGNRYDSRSTGFPIVDLYKNKEIVKKSLEELPGRLIIKQFPTKTANINKIKFHIERLRVEKNFNPDLIIIDYADLMRSTREYNEKTWELEAIYEEIRGMLGEFEAVGYTASQTNRRGSGEKIVTLDMIAEGYVKAQIADFVAGLSRENLFIAKNRLGPAHISLPVNFKPEISLIEIGELDDEGEVLEKSKDSGLFDLYQKFKDDKEL